MQGKRVWELHRTDYGMTRGRTKGRKRCGGERLGDLRRKKNISKEYSREKKE